MYNETYILKTTVTAVYSVCIFSKHKLMTMTWFLYESL